ncbi:MarR family transcriptional regulator [Luteibacter sp. Sphag1AF]|uniref:MarR family winged helix-turn-helix transcriptional regulator n=1 Tax=Luteibacter sp. Sphag1AF TaxID=2587031 RepID=UPI001612DA91|nr:MarR family transcriptional regulator [Luteibacter sp. Sphag1AF]
MDPLTLLQTRFTTLLPSTSRRWQRLLDTRLGDCGVSSACVVPVILIGRSGGGIHQVTLAEQLGVVGPSLVRTLDKLDEQGLVRRENDPCDRRAKTLWLTDTGRALAAELEVRLTALRHEVFAGISAEDIAAALRVHQALIDALPVPFPAIPISQP